MADGYEPADAREARFKRAEELARALHQTHQSNEHIFGMGGRFPDWDLLSEADQQIGIRSFADLIQDGVIK